MSPGWIIRSEKVCECGRPRRAGNGIHAFDALGAHAEQAVIGDRDQFVFARSRPDSPGDVDIGRVDHGAGHLQKLNLVGGLDLAGIEHRLLAIDDFRCLPAPGRAASAIP